MHVQSVQNYCFSLSNMQICDSSCCRRRCGRLSSLLRAQASDAFLNYGRTLEGKHFSYIYTVVSPRFSNSSSLLDTKQYKCGNMKTSLRGKQLTSACRPRLKNCELKQPSRRRDQKPHEFAYLTMKNGIYDILKTFSFFPRGELNDLFCSCVDDVSI